MIRFDGITINRHPRRRYIAHGGAEIHFAPRRYAFKFKLACALLLAGPKTKRELFDLLYRDDPDGGPLDPKIIDVMIFHLKPRFASIGIEIRCEGAYPKRYFAAPVENNDIVYLEAAE